MPIDPPIWCDIKTKPVNVPDFFKPYMFVVRDVVRGTDAIHETPQNMANAHNPYWPGSKSRRAYPKPLTA